MGNQPSGEQQPGQSPHNQSHPSSPHASSNTPRQNTNTIIPPAQMLSKSSPNQFDSKTGGFYTQKSYTSIRVLIRGGMGSGKTSLFNALQGIEFVPDYIPTEQLQYGKVSWSPHNAVTTLASAEFLKRSETTGLHETTQFKMNPQIDTDISVSIELVDTVDSGRRQLIPAHKLPNKNSLPPNIDLIDGNYYLPPVDSTTVDVWKNASALLVCIDPYSLPTYHYAVNILNSIPQHLLAQGLSVVLCLIKRDLPEVDRIVTDHMLNMLTTGTSIKTLHISTQNGYGLDKLRNYLLVPYLTARSLEFQRLSELYKQEAALVGTFMSQLIGNDDDYYKYIQIDRFNNNNNNNNTGHGGDMGTANDADNIGDGNDDLYDDLSYTTNPTTQKKKGGRFDDIDVDDDNDDSIGRGKNAKGKKNTNNTSTSLKITNSDYEQRPQKATSGNALDDFFGGDGGFGDGDDDIIVPQKKEKKKVKKVIKRNQNVDEDISSPSGKNTTAVKTKGKVSVPSFFDDDLDLEPVITTNKAKKPVPQSQIVSQQVKQKAKVTTTNAQNNNASGASFGGFFDDEEQKPQTLDPILLRPSSSHNIDEEAELAFFDGENDDNNNDTDNATIHELDTNNDVNNTSNNTIVDNQRVQTQEDADELSCFDDDDNDGDNNDDGNDNSDTLNKNTSNREDQCMDNIDEDGADHVNNDAPVDDNNDSTQLEPQITTQDTQDDQNIIQNGANVHNVENTHNETTPIDEDTELVDENTELVNESNQIVDEISEESIKDEAIDEQMNEFPQGQSIELDESHQNNHKQEEEAEQEQEQGIINQVHTTPTKPVSKGFFDDDDDDDNDDVIPIVKKSSPQSTSHKNNNNFFDDDDDDEGSAVIFTKKNKSKSTNVINKDVPKSAAFGDFDDDDVVVPTTTKGLGTGKKKVIAKKPSALEKQMAQLKKEEEDKKKKDEEDNNAGFTFKARASSSFYD